MERSTEVLHIGSDSKLDSECLAAAGDAVDCDSKNDFGGMDSSPGEGKVEEDLIGGGQTKEKHKEPDLEKGTSKTKEEESPVFGLVSGSKKTEPRKTQVNQGDDENGKDLNESIVKDALWERASHFFANACNITLAGVRRLIEEDLKLEKYSLDPFKKFISGEVDKILSSPPVIEYQSQKKKAVSKKAPEAVRKRARDESKESDEEEDTKLKKHMASTGKTSKIRSSGQLTKRELTCKETVGSNKKHTKSSAQVSNEKTCNIDTSQSSRVAKNVVSTSLYGKRVEHLKSIIKSCGMSIPPVIYKRAKQAPENKREAALIKELEDILLKEGLASNPTEKEIKDVRKKKQREKELEGIDMSNIVSSSRRRSTTSFIVPVKPKPPVESDHDSESDDDDEEDSDSDNVGNENEVEDGGPSDEGKSEDSN